MLGDCVRTSAHDQPSGVFVNAPRQTILEAVQSCGGRMPSNCMERRRPKIVRAIRCRSSRRSESGTKPALQTFLLTQDRPGWSTATKKDREAERDIDLSGICLMRSGPLPDPCSWQVGFSPVISGKQSRKCVLMEWTFPRVWSPIREKSAPSK